MMIFLVSDIMTDIVQDILTDRYAEVIILPRKSSLTQFVFVYPVRRFTFYKLNYVFDFLACAQ
jgi:hypothetical protein